MKKLLLYRLVSEVLTDTEVLRKGFNMQVDQMRTRFIKPLQACISMLKSELSLNYQPILDLIQS